MVKDIFTYIWGKLPDSDQDHVLELWTSFGSFGGGYGALKKAIDTKEKLGTLPMHVGNFYIDLLRSQLGSNL